MILHQAKLLAIVRLQVFLSFVLFVLTQKVPPSDWRQPGGQKVKAEKCSLAHSHEPSLFGQPSALDVLL